MGEKRILEELMRTDQYCSLGHFFRRLQVSTRAISSGTKYLMQDGERNGFRIHLKWHFDYYLGVTAPQELKQYIQSDEDSIAVSSKERVDTIIALLPLQSGYITQETIADTLAVSKSIVKADMAKVEKILFEHSISLTREAHCGISLSYEGMIRELYLLELQEKDNLYMKKIMDHCLSQQHIQHLEERLIALLKQYRLNTNYIELKRVDLSLKVSVLLAEKGIESAGGVIDSNVHKQAAVGLADVIQEIYQVTLNSDDICDIGNCLKQKAKPSDIYLYDGGLIQSAEIFLQDADEQYHTQFNVGVKFKKSLLACVSLLLDRLHQSIPFSNPLVYETSVRYPVAFNTCIRFANMLGEKYHVKTTQDEIGFIAAHFVARMEKELHHKLNLYRRITTIYSSGGGSAFLIKLKLETIFSSSNIGAFLLLELDEVRSHGPDIIFTIRKLDEVFDVPIAFIRGLLDDADTQKIKNMLETDASLALQGRPFTSLLRKNAFHIFQEGSHAGMVSCMAAKLEQEGYRGPGYATSVEQCEEVLSAVYNNDIAIPYPLEIRDRGDILSVSIVKQEASVHKLPIRVIFLVDLKKGDLRLHQNITRILFKVTSSMALIEKLRRAESYEDFMKCISYLKLQRRDSMNIQFSEKLSNVDGIASNEQEVRNVLVAELREYADEVSMGHLGSTTFKEGNRGPKIILCAYIGEAGFIIRSISDMGQVMLIGVGGVKLLAQFIQKVRTMTEDGKKIRGIIQATYESSTATRVHADPGAQIAQEVYDLGIQIGDTVTYTIEFEHFTLADVVAGKAFGDRLGCFIIGGILKRLQGISHSNTVYMVGASSEKVGIRGAKTAVYGVNPDVVFPVDVACFSDEFVRNHTNQCQIGKEMILTNLDRIFAPNHALIRRIKDATNISHKPLQLDIFNGGGADGGETHKSRGDKPTAVNRLPARYGHCTYSIAHLRDTAGAIDIFTELIVNPDEVAYRASINFLRGVQHDRTRTADYRYHFRCR